MKKTKEIFENEKYILKENHSEIFYKSYILVTSLVRKLKSKHVERDLYFLSVICKELDTDTQRMAALLHFAITEDLLVIEDLDIFDYQDEVISLVKDLQECEQLEASDRRTFADKCNNKEFSKLEREYYNWMHLTRIKKTNIVIPDDKLIGFKNQDTNAKGLCRCACF